MKFTTRKLSDVVFFQEGPGVRKFQFRNEGVKLLNVGNINKGKLNTTTTKLFISNEEAYGKYKHFLVDEGDLLIASSGIVVSNFHNKIAYASKEHLPLCLNTSTIRFKSLDKNVFTLDYLKFYLKTSHFKNQLNKLITGAAQLNFGPSHLNKIILPIPSFADQIQITNILSKAETLIEQRKQSIALLDELLRSSFLEMFGDPVVNRKGWNKKKLKELAEEFKYGTNLISSNEQNENSIPILRIPNILDSKINYDDLKFSVLDETEKRKLLLLKGDLLFVRTNGNPNYIARCAVFNDDKICGYASYLIRVRLKLNSGTTPSFIKYIASLPSFRKTIISKAKTTAGNYNINTDGLKDLNFIIPPVTLQTQFAQLVKKTEALKKQYKNSLQELENLYGSLSQQAFKCELKLIQ